MTRTELEKRIDAAIFWLVLGALFLIPLTFSFFGWAAIYGEPRVLTLHLLAGLILVLWAWRATLVFLQPGSVTESVRSFDLKSWMGRNPARWALVATAALVLMQVVSTILSPLPYVSFFGADEARTGYNLYDSLSMYVIFFSIILRFRKLRDVEWLINVLVISGTIAALYGIAQHFGWDPIAGNEGRLRPPASFGNTLNFSAYLVMAVPATLAMAYRYLEQNKERWIPTLVLALGVQLGALWISGGRGPYLASAAGLILFFAIAFALLDTKRIVQVAGLLLVSAIIAGVLSTLPSPQGTIGLQRFTSIGDQLKGDASTTSTDIVSGLTGRLNLWGSTVELATEWPTPVDEPVVNRILRPVFGLGPDMFVYSYPLVGKPQSQLISVDHAHNHPLQILAEQGYAGFVLFIAASAFLILAGVKIVRSLRAHHTPVASSSWILLAVLPAAGGKLVELQSGVPRISDMTMTLAMFAGVVVVHELFQSQQVSTEPSRLRRSPIPAIGLGFLGTAFASIVITVLVFSVFVGWDLRRMSAGLTLVDTYDDPSLKVRAQGWSDAQSKAPDRESLTHALSRTYLKEANLAVERDDLELAIALAKHGHGLLLDYEQIDPFEWDVQLLLAEITANLVDWGETEYAQEMADRQIKLVELYPSYPEIVSAAAAAVTTVGLYELAIDYSDRAIAMEETTRSWPTAWFAKGQALYSLGQEDEAIEVLLTGTEKEPREAAWFLSHALLSDIYQSRGNSDAAEHHQLLSRGQAGITP